MTRLILAALLLGSAAAAAPPQRIVSLNLCADQYLIALADRRQIAGVTRNATDPDMSAAAVRARGLHRLGSSAEEMAAIDPDLVIAFPGQRAALLGALPAGRYRAVELKSADSLGEIVAQIRQVAAAVGHPERGEALVAGMARTLAALPRRPRAGVAAYYQRRGFLTGTGTLVDDLMTRVGLTNLARTLGKPVLSQLSLEELVAARPDYLLVDAASARVADKGTEMLHHPALRDIPRLVLPEAWTVCGGPAYALAARSLAEQLRGRR